MRIADQTAFLQATRYRRYARALRPEQRSEEFMRELKMIGEGVVMGDE